MTVTNRWAVVLAAGISWLGLLLHNVADLPDQYPWSPETGYPTLALAALLAVYLMRPAPGSWLLVAWAVLHVIGGAVLSVLPLPLWPFSPEQSLRHYAYHVLYGLTQLPLFLIAVQQVRRRGRESTESVRSRT